MLIAIDQPLNPCPFCQARIDPGEGSVKIIFPSFKRHDIRARVVCPVCGAKGPNAATLLVDALHRVVNNSPIKTVVSHAVHLWNQCDTSHEARRYVCPARWCRDHSIKLPADFSCLSPGGTTYSRCERFSEKDICWRFFDAAKPEAESGATP